MALENHNNHMNHINQSSDNYSEEQNQISPWGRDDKSFEINPHFLAFWLDNFLSQRDPFGLFVNDLRVIDLKSIS